MNPDPWTEAKKRVLGLPVGPTVDLLSGRLQMWVARRWAGAHPITDGRLTRTLARVVTALLAIAVAPSIVSIIFTWLLLYVGP